MRISKKVSEILWNASDRYLAALTEEKRSQILSDTTKDCSRLAPEQTTVLINS